MRATSLIEYTDKMKQRLVVELMTEDLLASYEDNRVRLSELTEEVDSVFGEGATDRMAEWVTMTRMTGTEAVQWAATEWEHCRGIAEGAWEN